MRRAATIISLIALSACAACHRLSRDLHVTGTVRLSNSLQSVRQHENAVLFIVAVNSGGVPVAVHRVINPEFPVSFVLDSDDLIVPGVYANAPLHLRVQMNTHGNVGAPRRGDLEGAYANPVYPGDGDVRIIINRQI